MSPESRNYSPDEVRKMAEKMLTVDDKGPRGEEYLLGPTKRCLDILIAGPAVGVTLPIVILAGAAVLAKDPSASPIFEMKCCHPGYDRVPWTKIRTMVADAARMEAVLTREKPVEQLKRDGDPRILGSLGHLLRRSSVDELPQLRHVLLGSWSMVGPRPPTIVQWRRDIAPHREDQPFAGYIELLKRGIKFGITGVHGIWGRAELSLLDQLELERMYAKAANIQIDLEIIALTFGAVLSRKGAC